MMIFKILAAIFVFGIIILVHELGHFLMCKLMGVRVNEFAIGMGPKLLSFGKKETAYTLRLFPIGGFCAMEGEDEGAPTPSAIGGNADRAEDDGGEPALPDEEEAPAEPDPRAFPNKKVWRRILIVVAGAAMNLVLGYVLLVAYYGIFTMPDASGKARFSSTIIASLPETAVSYQTGLRPGDEIVKIDGKRTVTDSDIVMIMQSDEDGIMDMTVRRAVDGKKKTVLLKGVQFQLEVGENGKNRLIYDFKVLGIEKTVWSTLVQAGKMEYSVATMIWRSLGDLITGKYGINDLSGPVGTMDIIGDAVAGANTSEGMMTLIMLVVMITVNVGIFNLLPLPALDGGKIFFLVVNALSLRIIRRQIPARFENYVHLAGFVLLMGFMLVITFHDVIKLFQ